MKEGEKEREGGWRQTEEEGSPSLYRMHKVCDRRSLHNLDENGQIQKESILIKPTPCYYMTRALEWERTGYYQASTITTE